jgi:hypothetical protein
MAPSSGLTDYFGLYPQIPTEENMIPTERLPSFSENIENKRYMDALYQTMGVLGDAAYASAPFTGPAGVIVGTTLKGVGAAGKASKSKGIASLSEQADLVNKYARDENFVSPTIETLINRAPKDLKGKQITEWVNASANKGVKPKELEYLGIDEFIEANPNASIDEVVRGVSDNQIKIRKNVISGDDSPVLEFLESTPDTDPLDGSNFWQYKTYDYLYDIEKNDSEIQKELLDHYNEAWDVNKKSWDEVPETMHEEIADSLAKQEYRENPYEMIEFAEDSSTFAFGNEDTGYSIFVDGKRIDTGDVPYSNTEARIQLRDAMSREGYDFGGIEGQEYIYSDIQYKSYIDNNLPGGENYREVVFNWENAPENVGGINYSSHFDDENQIAHALVRDRTLENGSSSLHIDELQSDLHKEGSRYGYIPSSKQKTKTLNKINDILKDTPYSYEQTGTMTGIKKPNPDVEVSFVKDHDFANTAMIKDLLKDIDNDYDRVKGLMEFGKILSKDKTTKFLLEKDRAGLITHRQYYLEHKEAFDFIRDVGVDKARKISKELSTINPDRAVPNYPFKDDWYNMGIKSLLVDAIDEGKDAISISTSAAMKDRYSDRYHKFYEMLYDKKIPSAMQKLAKKYGGEFEKGSLDIDNTFGLGTEKFLAAPETGLDRRRNLIKSNIIKITPEMREKVLKEGISTFSAGGVIGNFPSRLAKI